METDRRKRNSPAPSWRWGGRFWRHTFSPSSYNPPECERGYLVGLPGLYTAEANMSQPPQSRRMRRMQGLSPIRLQGCRGASDRRGYPNWKAIRIFSLLHLPSSAHPFILLVLYWLVSSVWQTLASCSANPFPLLLDTHQDSVSPEEWPCSSSLASTSKAGLQCSLSIYGQNEDGDPGGRWEPQGKRSWAPAGISLHSPLPPSHHGLDVTEKVLPYSTKLLEW